MERKWIQIDSREIRREGPELKLPSLSKYNHFYKSLLITLFSSTPYPSLEKGNLLYSVRRRKGSH